MYNIIQMNFIVDTMQYKCKNNIWSTQDTSYTKIYTGKDINLILSAFTIKTTTPGVQQKHSSVNVRILLHYDEYLYHVCFIQFWTD